MRLFSANCGGVLFLLGMLASLTTADVAMAQRGGGGGIQTRARYELATLSEVQGELKLTDEQKKLATELLAKQREKRQSLSQGGDFQAMRTELAKLNTELDGQFVAKLDAAQRARINGVLAQVNGANSLLDAEIAKELKIGDEQMGKLKEASDAARATARQAMQGLQDSTPEARQEAMTKVMAEVNKTLLAVLNDDQKKQFEALKGAELKIDPASMRTLIARPRN